MDSTGVVRGTRLRCLLDIAGSVFAMRVTYQYGRRSAGSPKSRDRERRTVTVESLKAVGGRSQNYAVVTGVEIDGQPVARDTLVWQLASRLSVAEGETVALGIVRPDGRLLQFRVAASDRYRETAARAAPIGRDARLVPAHGPGGAHTCIALIVCAVLLFMRRPKDPVGCCSVQLPLLPESSTRHCSCGWQPAGRVVRRRQFAWLAVDGGRIALFPDGRFNPRRYAWILVVAPLAAIGLTLDRLPLEIGTITAFVAPLFLILSHVSSTAAFRQASNASRSSGPRSGSPPAWCF